MHKKDSKTIDVYNCGRCHGNHKRVKFVRMEHMPIRDGLNTIWNWWARCPVSGDPMLLWETEDKMRGWM